jgi:hypothetical protein
MYYTEQLVGAFEKSPWESNLNHEYSSLWSSDSKAILISPCNDPHRNSHKNWSFRRGEEGLQEQAELLFLSILAHGSWERRHKIENTIRPMNTTQKTSAERYLLQREPDSSRTQKTKSATKTTLQQTYSTRNSVGSGSYEQERKTGHPNRRPASNENLGGKNGLAQLMSRRKTGRGWRLTSLSKGQNARSCSKHTSTQDSTLRSTARGTSPKGQAKTQAS